MKYIKTNGKCKFGLDSIEVKDTKCMDALNFIQYAHSANKKDCWHENCVKCSCFGRKEKDLQDIIEALQEKGIYGEIYPE